MAAPVCCTAGRARTVGEAILTCSNRPNNGELGERFRQRTQQQYGAKPAYRKSATCTNNSCDEHSGFIDWQFSLRCERYTSVCEELAARLTGDGWPVLTSSTKPARLAGCATCLAVVRRRREYDVRMWMCSVARVLLG